MRLLLAMLAAALVCGGPAVAAARDHAADQAAPKSIAVLGFTLDNTSPAPSTPEELARTARMGRDFAAALQKSGRYRLVSTAPAAAMLRQDPDIRSCNGCEIDIGRKLGAQYVAYGWVQKVSNLILNLNAMIEDVATGKLVAGGSVDIRGNTDDSWDHGLQFLMQEHVFPR